MSFDMTYSLLFEVNIYSNYFLNDGELTYNSMSFELKQKMLLKYDWSNFLEINPSIATIRSIKNYKMLFKKTKTGFKIYTKVKQLDKNDPLYNRDPFIEIPTNLELIFSIKIKDSQFLNYTDLEFAKNRFFYFSNAIPLRIETNEPLPDPNPAIAVFNPLTFNYIPLIDDTTIISDDFLASELESNNLLPDFETAESRNLYGIIALCMTADFATKSILNATNKIITPTKKFKIHFDNRKTFWKYINTKTSSEIETNSEKPLTYSGFVEVNPSTDFTPPEAIGTQYPNPSVKSIKIIDDKTYSEIFI